MFACSLISDENKPYAGIYEQKQLRLQSDLYTTLITLHWFMCFNVFILILNQAFSEKITIFPLSSCGMDEAKQFISVHCLGIEVIPYRPPLQVYIGFMENSQYLVKI